MSWGWGVFYDLTPSCQLSMAQSFQEERDLQRGAQRSDPGFTMRGSYIYAQT